MHAAIPIQAFCVSVAVAVFAGGELVAHLLERWPGSPLLWQLDSEAFGFLDNARNQRTLSASLFTEHTLWIACALLCVVSAAAAYRHRLAMAVASNLTFIAVLVVVHDFAAGRMQSQTASLDPVVLATTTEGWLVATLLAAACVGFALSHQAYIARARSRWRARRA